MAVEAETRSYLQYQ